MKKAVNYVRGNICAKVECVYPERFVNICAQNGVEFWRMQRISHTEVTANFHIIGYRRLRALAPTAGFTIEPVQKSGIPFFVWKIRRRYALIAGMALCLVMLQVMSLFVFEMEIYGIETLPRRLLIENLEQLGVAPGAFGPSISSEELANEMLLRIPELSWIALNVRGSRLEVLVRERIAKPNIIDENSAVMVVAEKAGVIVKMSVLEGVRVFTEGDTVEAGDIIVSGIRDSISSGRRTVHAMAEVYARTWYEKSAKMPLNTIIKEHTGKIRKRASVNIAGKKINLFLNSGNKWSYYDKITNERAVRLPMGNALPISVTVEQCAEYTPVKTSLSVSDAEIILRERLLKNLHDELADGGVVSAEFETIAENNCVTVILRAECVEEIALERPFTQDELLSAEGEIIFDERENNER